MEGYPMLKNFDSREEIENQHVSDDEQLLCFKYLYIFFVYIKKMYKL